MLLRGGWKTLAQLVIMKENAMELAGSKSAAQSAAVESASNGASGSGSGGCITELASTRPPSLQVTRAATKASGVVCR